MTVKSITPLELKELLASDNPPLVVDVREPDEVNICALSCSLHMPLGTLMAGVANLPTDQAIVTLCHHGRRSLQAALLLQGCGFSQILNLAGGIHAWAEQVEPSMNRY